MNFWLTLFGYQAVWFVAVIAAGQGHTVPGMLAAALFVAWRVGVSSHRALELRLIAISMTLGLALDGLTASAGWLRYAGGWPSPWAPAWLTSLWAAFAVTIVPLFGYFRSRPLTAACLGGVGGPLAYLGAARGWQAVEFVTPQWRGILALAVAWALILPLLCLTARQTRSTSLPVLRMRGGPR